MIFDANNSEVKPSEEEAFHTNDSEEAEVAIDMLSVFIKELKSAFHPYIEGCTKLVVPLCQYQHDENVRTSSAECLVSLLESVK